MADKTIWQMTQLNMTGDLSSYADDEYLVSHPLGHTASGPAEYVTFSIPFKDLVSSIASAAYLTSDAYGFGLRDKISTDLSLGDLAHLSMISGEQVEEGAIDLLYHVRNAGPLARPTASLPALSDELLSTEASRVRAVSAINHKLGFKDLAFKSEADLDLNKYAHASALCLADFKDISATGKIGLSTAAELSTEIQDSISTFLSLGKMAHVDTVRQVHLGEKLNFDASISGFEGTLDGRYLSAPKDNGSTYGSIKVGYQENGKNYPVKLSAGKAYVTVPWQNGQSEYAFKLSAVPSKSNTIALVTTTSLSVDGHKVGSDESTVTEVTLRPYIADNITRGSGFAGYSKGLAVFTSDTTISSTDGTQFSNDKEKWLRGDGSFAKIPLAASNQDGLMSKAVYSKLQTALQNIPAATTTVLGGVKLGTDTKLASGTPVGVNVNGQAYVDIGQAGTNKLGCIKTGFAKNGNRYPVKLDINGNAYAEVTIENDTAGLISQIVKAIYPVGAIYITATQTNICPLQSLAPDTYWQKVEGYYLLASGTLAGTKENNIAGATVAAGLPDHAHRFEFYFSGSGSKSGYPNHGSGKACNHKSNTFTTSFASGYNSNIYGKSQTVRPPAYVVSVFRRTA